MGVSKKGGGQKRDLDHMIETCNAELRANPHSAPLLRRRGEAKRKLHRHEEAVADFDAALALEPHCALALAGRGSALRAMGRHTQALASLDAALKLEPRNGAVLMARAVALQALGRYVEGEVDLNAALALQPRSAFGLQLRGELRRKLGKHKEAIADYDAALGIAPRYVPALAGRGAAYRSSGRHREAVVDYDAALRLEPQNASVLSGRGAAKMELGLSQEAMADFNAALEIDPHDEFANWGIKAAGSKKAAAKAPQAAAVQRVGGQAPPQTVTLTGFSHGELNVKYMERSQSNFAVGGRVTYWSADGEHFLYYCKKESRWKGSRAADFRKVQAGGVSGVLGAPQGSDIMSSALAKGWYEFDGTAWQHRPHAGVARSGHLMAQLKTITLVGFGRTEMNVKYAERRQPEYAVCNRGTFWSADGMHFLFWCEKENRWKGSRAEHLAKIQAGGSSGLIGAPLGANIASQQPFARGWHEWDGTKWTFRQQAGVARVELLAVQPAGGEPAAKRQKVAHIPAPQPKQAAAGRKVLWS